LAEESTITCPLCGNKAASGTNKCPVCGTEFHKVRVRKIRERGPHDLASGDLLRKEIPKLKLRETKLNCPFCAMELNGGEYKCPRCGVPLSTGAPPKAPKPEEELLECPECGKFAPMGAKKCPNCGVGFEVGPEAPVLPAPEQLPPPPSPEPTVPPEHPFEPVPEPLALLTVEPSKEVVTAVTTYPAQPSEGFINGKGSSSDRGFVNGTGLVNGTGMTNGTKADIRVSASQKSERSFITRWQFLAVLVALVIIIPTFVYLSYFSGTDGLAIDGDFGDWDDVDKFSAYITSGSPAIDIDEWAVKAEASGLFLYLKVQGSMMSTTSVESFFLFVDSDDSESTGYSISEMGADYMIQIDGWENEVRSAALNSYSATITDRVNWTGWTYVQGLSFGLGDSELEARAELPASLGQNARYMMLSQDQVARNSMSYPVPQAGGMLIVRQEPGSGIVQSSGTVPAQAGVSFLRLTFTCEGAGGRVISVEPSVSGAVLGWTFQEVELELNEPAVVDVTVDTSASALNSLVAAFLQSSMIESTFADVIVFGDAARAYVSSAPDAITIDGAFGDWVGKTAADADSVPIVNLDIDVTAVGAVNDTTSAAFYVSVRGQMCAGSYIPFIVSKPTGGGGGGIVIPTRTTGEDILRVYIDSDMSSATGYLLSMPSKTIGADYIVEVRGLDGRIVSQDLKQYVSGSWTDVAGAVLDAAKDLQRLELSVDSASIGDASSIEFIVETTDWLKHTDLATAVPLGTRAVDPMFVSTLNPEGWFIENPTTSSLATAMSYQRKLFHDGTNFWSFYWDGTNTVYRYSTDNGASWSSTSVAFKTAAVNEVSVWYDGANHVVYAVGDTSAASTSIYLQRGTVDPATHTITWASSDSTLAASANSLGGKNTFICKDAAGYVWVLAGNLTNAISPVRYDLSAFISSSADTISSWAYSGNMLDVDSNLMNGKGVIVPTGTGNGVWTVYAFDGSVQSRKYTGIWSAQSDIYLLGATENPGNTDNAPPSAVVDGNGVLHVVYGDGHQQGGVSKPHIYHSYNTGSSWAPGPYRLDTINNPLGNVYPTISLDTSTGVVYAFWIETDNAGVGVTIRCKKNVSGTWQSLTLSGQTADPKQYLTSVYSASSETLIAWQWTQNTTAPIQVIFDKIPEFDGVALPVLFLMAVVLVVSGRKARRRDA